MEEANKYKNINNDNYTLELTKHDSGKYMVDYVRGLAALNEDQKNKLVELLDLNKTKSPGTRPNTIVYNDNGELYTVMMPVRSGSRRRRRPSRKYKKSAKRVFRKKSRSTRRR